jgi:hypothetical protein
MTDDRTIFLPQELDATNKSIGYSTRKSDRAKEHKMGREKVRERTCERVAVRNNAQLGMGMHTN